MSLGARLLNVFATPGEVFEDVKISRPCTSNWLVPMVLSAIIGAFSAVVIFSQPSIQQELREKQDRLFDNQVKAGKLKKEDADKAREMAEKFTGPTVMKVAGACGALVAAAVRILWWARVLKLLANWFLKQQLVYGKCVETAGLAIMIGVLGSIVTLLLILNFSRMSATPSLALVIPNFDVTRKSHLLLGAVNVFSFWTVVVMSMGLSRLAGVPFFRAAPLVWTFWVLQELFFIMVGLGSLAL
jgi:hypothetical protein